MLRCTFGVLYGRRVFCLPVLSLLSLLLLFLLFLFCDFVVVVVDGGGVGFCQNDSIVGGSLIMGVLSIAVCLLHFLSIVRRLSPLVS